MEKMSVKILKDGTVKSTTGEVGAENHQNAEAFLALISRLTGGPVARDRRGGRDDAHHSHDASHHHGAGGHTH